MSKLSEEYLKILNDIDEHISDENEKKYVLKKVSKLSSLYMDIIDRITSINSNRMDEIEKHQDELEERLDKVSNTVGLIKKDIYEDDEYDFEIVCPYCNHEFVADVEDELKEEVECPECHNIIELDWDESDEGCSGMCSSCGLHDKCEDDHEENNDDDM
ncbi:MAG: hypothetical protein ACI4VC_00490 [Clostridia bacterium]